MTGFDEQPDAGPHDECAAEIHRLEQECGQTCEDCDHGTRCGAPCESCGGTGKVTYRALYEATKQHVKELKGDLLWLRNRLDAENIDNRKTQRQLATAEQKIEIERATTKAAVAGCRSIEQKTIERCAKVCDENAESIPMTNDYLAGCRHEAESLAIVIRTFAQAEQIAFEHHRAECLNMERVSQEKEIARLRGMERENASLRAIAEAAKALIDSGGLDPYYTALACPDLVAAVRAMETKP
jgi:hypothetical protein